jgi:hypothetical protein
MRITLNLLCEFNKAIIAYVILTTFQLELLHVNDTCDLCLLHV